MRNCLERGRFMKVKTYFSSVSTYAEFAYEKKEKRQSIVKPERRIFCDTERKRKSERDKQKEKERFCL